MSLNEPSSTQEAQQHIERCKVEINKLLKGRPEVECSPRELELVEGYRSKIAKLKGFIAEYS